MLKKGILFSLDAIFALVIAGIMITGCFFYLSQNKVSNDLYQISLDSLTLLEKDDTFANVLNSNLSTGLQTFLDGLSDQYCGNITLYSSYSSHLYSSTKSGCVGGNESSVGIRSFVYDSSNYYAKMEAWYK